MSREKRKPNLRSSDAAPAPVGSRAVFDQSTQFIVLLKPDGTILDANRRALALRRLNADEVRGQRFWQASWCDFSREVRRRVRAAVASAARGESAQLQLELLDSRGDVVTFDFAFTRAMENRGQATMIVVEGLDVTAQKRVEEALRRSRDELDLRIQNRTAELDRTNNLLKTEVAQRRQGEEASARLAAIVESSSDAIIGMTLTGSITSWNKGAQRVFGYAAQEIIGRSIMTLIPRERESEEERILSAIRRGERVENYETERVRKDGRRVVVSLSVSPIKDPSGRITGVAKIARDISESRRMVTELHDNEARLRAILSTTVDGVITINEAGVMESANPAAERLFGYLAAELIGRNVRMLMPDPYASQHDGYLSNYGRTGIAKIIGIGREVLGLRKDGQTFPMDLAVSEVWVGGRRLFTGFVRDITERRRLEKAILDISGAEQQRIGQDLHDGLGQHLTGIAFKARVLADELQSDAPRHARPAREIGSLVQEAISRTRDLAHGLAPVGLQKHGLSTALQELARSTQQMGVRCTFKCGRPAAIENETVGLHLYRIAQESVNNAIKHGRARNVSIMLDSRRGEITLKIRDDGIGYPEISSDKSGIGQKIMQYRASLIGAALLIRPVPGSGTVVICSLRESQPTTKDNRNGNGQGARRRASTQKNRSARR